MSNYSKTTDFEAKDSLPTGDSGKIIRGAEFETEFDAISTAIGTKADTAGPTFTGTLTFETISDGTIGVTAFVDEDNMSSNSATLVPTQQSVKAYVDAQVTAQDLDFQADSGGALSIDLDSEALTFTGGTGVDTSGSGNAVTFAIDSTVATLTGTQTLTNKTLTSPDVNTPDIDGGTIDGTVIGGATPAAVSATTVSATGNITVGGTVDGRDVATDGTKLDGIEASATADQTAAEIRTLVGSASDSNVFTDADHSKLDGIEASATADQTAAEIRTLVESASDSNVFTDADHTKLNAIEASATADQTDAEIRAAVEAATDSNVFTDADHTKLNAIEASADVTDTANVTAAGALMDSELTSIASVKALNQGVATTDSPTFAGATVNGTVTADGLEVEAATPVIEIDSTTSANLATLQFTTSGTVDSKITHQASTGVMTIDSGRNASWGGKIDFVTDTDTRMRIANNGDISFYEDTGTTAKLFWDSSAESLGVGTSSVGAKLHVLSGTDNNIAADVSEVRFIGADKAITGEQANLVIQTNDDMAVNKGGSIGLGGRHTTSSTNGGNFAQISGRKENATSANFAGYLAFGTSDSASDIHERMRIDASGNVGIGADVPDSLLHLKNTGADVRLTLETGESHDCYINFSGATSEASIGYDATDNALLFCNPAGSLTSGEKMRLDASGNLLVGTTTAAVANGTTAGIAATSGDQLLVGTSSDVSAAFNRITSDGDIVLFRKDGTTVGSIFNSGTTMGVGSLDTGVLLANNIDAILPWNASTNAERDAAIDLGRSAGRFKDLHLSGNISAGTGGSNSNNYEIKVSAGTSGLSRFIAADTAAAGYIDYDHSSNSWIHRTDSQERMRISSAGHTTFGTTDLTPADNSVNGTSILSDGRVNHNAQSQPAAVIGRTGTDGTIVDLRKSGTTVGSIGTSGGDLTVGTGDTGLTFEDSADVIHPINQGTGAARDNAIDLGKSAARFDDLYATNGTIQTSDRNEKQDIEELSDAEQRVAVAAKGLLRKFRWIDSVENKGNEARIHFGIIAQDLQNAFTAEGLDAGRYAMFTSTTWTDEETGEERTRMGVRYSELLAFIISAI